MSAAELLNDQAKMYELQAAAARERIQEEAMASESLLAAVQEAVYLGIVIALKEVAVALEEAA